MISVSNIFSIKFWKVGKPTGKRGFNIFGPNTDFEDVKLEVLKKICEKVYQCFHWEMIDDDIEISRIIADNSIHEYKAIFKEHNSRKVLAELDLLNFSEVSIKLCC